MNTLPTEIRTYILSFFPAEYLISTFKSVSKEYLRYTQELVTQYKPAVRFRDVLGDAQLAVLARDYPRITSLDLLHCTSIGYTGLKVVLTQFPKLKSLVLPCLASQAGEIFHQPLCPSVTRLDMRAMYTQSLYRGEVDIAGCGHIPKAFPNIEELLIPFDLSWIDTPILMSYNPRAVTLRPCHGKKLQSNCEELTLTQYFDTIDIKDCTNLKSLYTETQTFKRDVLAQISSGLEKLTIKPGSGDLDPVLDLLTSNKLQQLRHVEFVYPQRMRPEHLQRLVTSCQHVKKIVIKIPAYATSNYLTLEHKALELKHSQTRVHIIVLGGEHRTQKIVHNHSEYDIPSEESEENILCSHCKHSVKKCDLVDHYEVCLKWPGWSCLLHEYGCQVKNMTRAERRTHLKSCTYYEYQCTECDMSCKMDCYEHHCKQYKRRDTYRHKAAMLQCPNKVLGCVAVLSSYNDLTRHMRACTADKGDYTCKACDKDDIESRAALIKHLHEDCRGDKRKRLVSDEGQVKLKEIAERMEKERANPWVDPVLGRRLNWSW